MERIDSRQSQPAIIGIPLTTRQFHYSLLRDAHIRLIHLDAGAKNDGLGIQIQENVYLETAPVYEALSYTWGDSKKECRISCGSESIAITANLAAALVQIRSPDKPRTLWIDQICINQDDVEERNKQVALMRRIYSKAENVVVWLGEEGPDDEMAFGFVPILLSHLPPLSAGHEVTRQGLVARQAIPLVGSPAWIALSRIFNRRYFRRSWIIQEVALARHAMVHCGPYVIEWDLLAAASSYQMGQLASDAENAHDAVAAIMGFHRNDHGRGNNLVDALFMSYRFNCTDPRDKVFAMLGLIQALVLQPDYSSSVEDVYLQTTRILILALGNLDILCCVSHPKTRIATLPSWVPDWQAQVAVKRKLGKSRAREPDAPSHQVRFSDNHRTLTVDGWCVGSIATVAAVFTRNESGLDIGWNGFVEGAVHPDGRPYTESYWRTLLAGESLPGTTSDGELQSAYEAWQNLLNRGLGGEYKPLTELPDENEKGSEFDRAMTETCVGRRLFTTAQHNLGLGPGEARVGDAVCFLGNTSTPFVLRPKGNYFELVGESYVHEFVEQGLPLPRLTGKEDIREFTIR